MFAHVHSLRFVTALSKRHRVHTDTAQKLVHTDTLVSQTRCQLEAKEHNVYIGPCVCACVCVSGGVNVSACGHRTLAEIRACSPTYVFQTLMILCVFCDVGGQIQDTKKGDTFVKFRGGGSFIIIKD